jgi:hypothetical protein
MIENATLFTHYCERTQSGFFAEPFNILSNISFIIAGLICLKHYFSNKSDNAPQNIYLLTLILLLFLIGLGSTLWHVTAEPWAEYADAVPILCFIGLYILVFLRKIANLPCFLTILLFLVFQIINISVILYSPKYILNGSLFYFPTLMIFIVFSFFTYKVNHPYQIHLRTSLILFVIAIIFRTYDAIACSLIPIGTHFIWHILVAFVLYHSTLFLIYNNKV